MKFFDAAAAMDVSNDATPDALYSNPAYLLPDDSPATPTRSSYLNDLPPVLMWSPTSPKTRSQGKKATQQSETFVDFQFVECELVFFVSSHRTNTAFGIKQGDHATPYACFARLLCNLMEGDDLDKVPDKIVEITKIFLPEEAKLFDKILTDYHKKNPLKREQRKNITQTYRSAISAQSIVKKIMPEIAQFLTPEELVRLNFDLGIIEDNQEALPELREALKLNEIRSLAELIKKMANKALEKMNSDQHVSFLRSDSAETKKSNPIKTSLCGLSALDRLISVLPTNYNSLARDDLMQNIQSEDLQKVAELVFESHSKFKTGLKRLFGLLPSTEENQVEAVAFDRRIQGFKGNNLGLMAFIIGKLQAVKVEDVGCQLIIDLFDFSFLEHAADANILETLAIISIKHLAIISKCFPAIGNNPDLKIKLEESFLRDGVLNQNGWDKFQVNTTIGKSLLDFDLLMQKIIEISKKPKYQAMAKCLSLDNLKDKMSQNIKKRKEPETSLDSSVADNHNELGDSSASAITGQAGLGSRVAAKHDRPGKSPTSATIGQKSKKR
jgi:hypothetical protein